MAAKETVQHIQLSLKLRIMCGIVGAAGLGAGGTATFVTSNSAGTGVMLIVGAVFSYLAITGVSIARAKIGDNEIDFQPYEEVVSQVLEFGAPEAREEVAEAVVEKLPVDDPTRLQAQEILYARDVLHALLRVGAELHVLPLGASPFNVVVSYRGSTIGVTVSWYNRMIGSAGWDNFREFSQSVGDALSSGMVNRALLVSARGLYRTPPRDGRLSMVTWRTETDDAQLLDALSGPPT